ncbi:hypothetical protein BC829DRAFT_6036 [Chytridium lagenaria]|nr:hypothetical protein BC829DRAFT_6036 [Chytridium lagenaria]
MSRSKNGEPSSESANHSSGGAPAATDGNTAIVGGKGEKATIDNKTNVNISLPVDPTHLSSSTQPVTAVMPRERCRPAKWFWYSRKCSTTWKHPEESRAGRADDNASKDPNFAASNNHHHSSSRHHHHHHHGSSSQQPGTGAGQSSSQQQGGSSSGKLHSSSPNVVGVHYKVGKKIGEGSFGIIMRVLI